MRHYVTQAYESTSRVTDQRTGLTQTRIWFKCRCSCGFTVRGADREDAHLQYRAHQREREGK